MAIPSVCRDLSTCGFFRANGARPAAWPVSASLSASRLDSYPLANTPSAPQSRLTAGQSKKKLREEAGREAECRAIDAARKYVDAGRVGRGRAPRGPESKHSEMRCKAIAGRSGSAPYQRRQINIFHCRSNSCFLKSYFFGNKPLLTIVSII